MNEFSILLADDDPNQLQYLETLVTHLRPNWKVVAKLTSVENISAILSDLSPTLGIFDVKFSGTPCIELMHEFHAGFPMIFVTGDASYATQAFDCEALDFMVKPLSKNRVEKSLQRAEHYISHMNQRLMRDDEKLPKITAAQFVRILKGRDVVVVGVEDVKFFQAEHKYTRVVLESQEGLLRMGLSSVEERIASDKFWRIHRSVIVNAQHIALVRRDELGRLFVRMRDRSEELLVAKPYEARFRDGFL